MSELYSIKEETLTSIANAIRSKNGSSDTYTPSGMADAIAAISSGSVEHLSWHQCPELVRNYLVAAAAAYPTAAADFTVINENDYGEVMYQNIPDAVSNANSKPIGYTIDGITFYNNEPGVATPFATTNKAGTLMALDWLRWYNTTLAPKAEGSEYPRGKNCRDLGGWACDGGTIKYGMLVRGSEPNPADKDLMVNKIGIKTEVQLLPVSEQGTDYKKKSAWGIDWAGNDTDASSIYSITDSKALWKKLLEPIMDSIIHSKPVYFHCGVGADRTGVIAMMLEGLLGVSRANVDMDFELTNFALGWKIINGNVYRSRAYPTYQSMMTAWMSDSSNPLVGGLTDSFRNRCISHVLSCGIKIDKINAFRAAMIDGNPEIITITVPAYTISKSGININFDNQITSVNEYDSYNVGVTPVSGYVISDVSITMGGVDITDQAFSGTTTVRRVSITNNLTHCITSNNANVAEAGTAYVATIIADDGYTLDGATITITMGGTNMSQYYSNGTISIPAVTGNIVINISAVESVRVNLFDPANARYNKRIGYSDGGERNYTGGLVTNMIDITNINTLTVEGITELNTLEGVYALESYYSTDTFGQGYLGYKTHKSATYVFDIASCKAEHPTMTHIAFYFGISTSTISEADVTDLAIYGS